MDPLTITFISIGVSITVSTIVTLAVEWIAKPQLEARKEHILDRHRALRAISALAKTEKRRSIELELDRIERTSPLHEFDEEIEDPPSEDSPYGQFRRLRAEVDPPQYHVEEIILSSISSMLSVSPGVVEVRDRAHVLEAAANALTVPRWRPRTRRRLYKQFFDTLGEAGM
ncbi:hypothetical protein [Glycomyces tenuis]|uniref:hypothetical protein n=1 Tax=Glycomyces tenuis TaxID=58116 RepID=UPI00047983C4|nr:hypothetical protein [Glycomyces tenuis]